MYQMNPIQANPMGGDAKTLCQRYLKYHVIAQMRDGSQFEGIIDDMDDDGVTMLVPEEVDGEERENDPTRQPYGQRRYRRYRRQHFPFIHFVFPFFRPYPYYQPYYPYYPGYGYGYGGGY
ncbi:MULTISPECIES: hypothetical protein [unclassified Paenibacillus]|uniref:hypothetical protein n=1 Tax=unclassified Paenibacillus TaxID=185978 RepID=UPI0027889CD1|nr:MULTISPECIES: hypothetical protein [unclassified Paenibacillus]MDQ0899025.1 hypothetical protein [Paenibacillus sp. V4I7]MDQ0914988.1 hypothetical protein [Paenibacillus sp. V4I5]